MVAQADLPQAEQIQTATPDFFWPIAIAYVVVCVTWLIVRRLADDHWEEEPLVESNRPRLDFSMIFVVVAGMAGLGAAYRHDLLLPALPAPWTGLASVINLCLPFAPIFLVLAIRRQPLGTVWISRTALPWKISTGLLSGILGLLVFLGLRGELHRLPDVYGGLFQSRSWIHAVPVFLEAVAVAFVFIRLRWISSFWTAVLVPCLLFAAAHVPSGVASGRPVAEIIAFFVFNSLLAAFIFSTVARSRDVIWIAIPHFILDIAIGAFD